MKRPIILLWRILLDAGLQSLDSIKKDLRYAEGRMEKEGLSFLTITLPRLDDALLKGLSSGRVTPEDFMGFRSCYRGGTLPAFMRGLFTRVFHDDGSLRFDADPQAIAGIRQVARLFKKVELPCSDARIKAGYERYRTNDERVAKWSQEKESRYRSCRDWHAICGYLWSGLERLSDSLYCHRGHFGPGATAERLKSNERWTVTEWPLRSEASFPSSFHAVSREDSPDLERIKYLDVQSERPVRVVQVPKTLLSPRTISVEPSYMMLMQQSIAKPLMAYLESQWEYRGSIGFTDQTVNRERARIGSIDGSLATIDLKDASDMVPMALVENIFGGVAPTFLRLISDCRTTKAQLPDGTILNLAKFASMGSALCFPIEAMVFYTIICYAIVQHLGRRPSKPLLDFIAKEVVVYGDDIIVPTEWAKPVILALEDHGMCVNHDKSFLTGLFRESCGGDYYKGYDVTPSYVRHWNLRGSHMSTETLVGAVSLSNQFYMKGYWNAAFYLRETVERFCGKELPSSTDPIGGLTWHSFFRNSQLRYERRVHSYSTKTYRIRTKERSDQPGSISGGILLSFRHNKPADGTDDLRDVTTSASARLLGVNSIVRMGNRVDRCHFDNKLSEVPGRIVTSIPKRDLSGDSSGGRSLDRGICPSGRSIYPVGVEPNGCGYCPSLREELLRVYSRDSSFPLCVSTHMASSNEAVLFSNDGGREGGTIPLSVTVRDWRELIIDHNKTMLALVSQPRNKGTLMESVVRQATSLKPGWTATQAGLGW